MTDYFIVQPPICLTAYHPEGYLGPARAGRHVVANMTLVRALTF